MTNRSNKIAWFIAVLMTVNGLIHDVNGQDEKPAIPLDHFYIKADGVSPFRKILSKIHFGFSTGYGRTFYKQDLSGFTLLQQQDSTPLIFANNLDISNNNVSTGLRYWYNDVNQANDVTINPTNDFLVNSDTTDLVFRAPSWSIPIMATLHVEFMDRYKIGGGFMFEYHRPGAFEAKDLSGRVAPIQPNFGSAFFKKYFLILGGKVYRYYEYLLSVDAHIGAFNLSKKFNSSLIQKGVFFNLGATVERELSEYFTAFVRPSYDFKNYTITPPESGNSVNTRMNAFFIGVGVTYRVPELRRCFIKTCTTQVNHQHGNKEYRSRMHPIFKKQNPHHGENFPRLFKNKKKNRKKLNPY